MCVVCTVWVCSSNVKKKKSAKLIAFKDYSKYLDGEGWIFI